MKLIATGCCEHSFLQHNLYKITGKIQKETPEKERRCPLSKSLMHDILEAVLLAVSRHMSLLETGLMQDILVVQPSMVISTIFC